MATISTIELAAALGITRQRVNKLGRTDKITREPDGRWNLDRVRAQLGKTLDNQQEARARIGTARAGNTDPAEPSGNVHDVFNRARAFKETAIAKLKQLELQIRQGELLEKSDVENTWTRGFTAFKNRLLLFPDKVAPKVAVCPDVLECRAEGIRAREDRRGRVHQREGGRLEVLHVREDHPEFHQERRSASLP